MAKVRGLKWVLGAVIVAVVAGVIVLLLAPRPVPVDVDIVRSGPIADSVADQGSARVREAYVVSAPVSGRLGRLDLHVGDRVVAGQTVIARIRPASAELLDPRSRAQAQAAVATASAAIATGQAQVDQLAAEARKSDASLARTRALFDRGFASGQALDSAVADARAARAAVRAATAQVAMRRSELAAARAALIGPEAATGGEVPVTPPASGYVTRVLQESERNVAVGAPLVEVSDQSGLEAAIEFLSQDAVRIREGMAAEVYDWGGGGPISAVVRRVEPLGFTKVSALGVEEQRVLVMLQFKGDPETWSSLGPGYRLWGRVFLRQEPRAVKTPLGALVRLHGRWAVFRVAEGRARLTPIEVGAITDREAEVRKGLSAGDKVVVFPSDKVADGVRLRERAG
ncbi:MAG TPA: HlyD family efflux transporter periplasmic adaptor subunit [Phenylobacterium sp.]|nr:HlyD family efflux transporter periplasmic adaptor subunit [Phenylobacterium sp.]